MTSGAIVARHRKNISDLSAIAGRDLAILARKHSDPERLRDVLLEALPIMASVYGAAAATLGADWYDDLRDASGVPARFRAIPASPAGAERTDVLARWAVGPLFQAEPDLTTTTTNLAGGIQEIIADADRQTITTSSVEDPRASGWERSTSGGCDFCRELASHTYHYEADFASHTHCACVAVPIFG